MLLISFDFDDGLALIGAAVGAHVMGKMHLAAAFAADKLLQRQRIVRTTPILTANGMFTFWQRAHEKLLKKSSLGRTTAQKQSESII